MTRRAAALLLAVVLGVVGTGGALASEPKVETSARTTTTLRRTATTVRRTTTTVRPTTTTTRPRAATTTTVRRCDAAYPTVCLPPPPPDLNCGDISARNFTVRSPDPHRLDADRDGIGCES